MVFDEPAVERLGLLELAQLEERQPEQVARPLVARLVAQQGFAAESLMRPDGFNGADGQIALGPDGQVRRGLVVMELDQKGSHLVRPAPGSAAAPS